MNQEDILKMAREAGFTVASHSAGPVVAVDSGNWWAYIERFAALVAAKAAQDEREASAKLAAAHEMPYGHCVVSGHAADMTASSIAKAIRSRS